jgi:hypothetical protein
VSHLANVLCPSMSCASSALCVGLKPDDEAAIVKIIV